MCVAGQPLGVDWVVVGDMCDFKFGGKRNCDDVFDDLKDNGTVLESCGSSDWKPVYARNIETYNIVVKDKCKLK